MSGFIYDDLDTIDLGDGLWVKIKRKMSYGDKERLTAHYIQIHSKLETQEPDVSMDVNLETGNMMLLLLNVKEWNLTGRDDKVAPIDKEHLNMLDPDLAQIIVKAIGERNPRPKAGS